MPRSLVSIQLIPLALAVSALLGVGAAAADQLGAGTGAGTAMLLVSSAASWGLAAAVVGALSRTLGVATLAGTAVLIAADVTYYATVAPLGGRDASGGAVSQAATVWALLAIAAGPVCGGCGWLLRQSGPKGRAVAASVLGGAFSTQPLWATGRGGGSVVTAAALVVVAVAVAITARRHAVPALLGTLALGLLGAALWPLILGLIR